MDSQVSGLPHRSLAQTRTRVTLERSLGSLLAQFGYEQLDTPSIEPVSVPETEQYHRLMLARGDARRPLALRSDLTISLVSAISSSLPRVTLPKRLVQVGSVWRGERPQRGRYRQARRFDVDIVSWEPKVFYDAEVLYLAYRCLDLAFAELGPPVFRLSHSGIPREILVSLGYACETGIHKDSLRLLRRSRSKERGELMQALVNLGMSLDSAREFSALLEIGSTYECRSFLKTHGASVRCLEVLEAVARAAESFGVPESSLRFDFSMSGTGYYDGIVFEEAMELASRPLLEGGKYSAHRNEKQLMSGVGFSMDLDALVEMTTSPDSGDYGLILCAKSEDEALDMLADASRIRNSGISVSIAVSEDDDRVGQRRSESERMKRAFASFEPDGTVVLRDALSGEAEVFESLVEAGDAIRGWGEADHA